MKTSSKIFICALVLLLCAAFAFAGGKKEASSSDKAYVAGKGTLVVGITDFAPMDYKEGNEWIGFDADMAKAFAKELGTQLIHFVTRDNEVQRAEIHKKTVIDHKSDAHQADEYRELARKIEENTQFVIPKPLTQERLEEILLEYGLLDAIEDNYHI